MAEKDEKRTFEETGNCAPEAEATELPAEMHPLSVKNNRVRTQAQACRNCQRPGHRIRVCPELCRSCAPSCGMLPSMCPAYLQGPKETKQRGSKRAKKPEKAATILQDTPGLQQTCDICGEILASRIKLFRHLETFHNILGSSSVVYEKAVLLVGWMRPESQQDSLNEEHDEWMKDGLLSANWVQLEAEDFVNAALLAAISAEDESVGDYATSLRGMSRSSSCAQRASYALGQELSCNAACETFALQLKKLLGRDVHDWVAAVNRRLPSSVRVLARESLPPSASEFHAEMFCSQRLYEYVIPLSFLWSEGDSFDRGPSHADIKRLMSRRTTAMESHSAGGHEDVEGVDVEQEREQEQQVFKENSWGAMDAAFPINTPEGRARVDYFRRLKGLLKYLAGKHSFHNFATGGASPDELAVKRRLDRIYHKDLLVIDGEHYVVLSVSGDGFLRGQVRKLIGAVISIMKGWLPIDYLEALLSSDDVYDAPSAPGWPLYLTESKYDRFEAKFYIRLDPRRVPVIEASRSSKPAQKAILRNESTDEYREHENQCRGMDLENLNTEIVNTDLCKNPEFLKYLSNTTNWKAEVRTDIVRKYRDMKHDWLSNMESRCRLLREKYSNLKVHYSRSKEELSQMMLTISPLIPKSLPSLGAVTLHDAYANVLRLLQEADRSGNWPLTSVARQKILFESAPTEETLGGSFSVGVYPAPLAKPKGNELFPELVIACFLLEKIISPSRPPSSTIAINRHAQFRPHRDSGAGNGQSGSLIVALGDFTGGELVVEGVPKDIRYQPLEFDGWKERHWTLPFHGMRYSLVWFTPLGVDESDFFWLDQIRKYKVMV